eukprot:476936-Hanusia_phi.AAC.2
MASTLQGILLLLGKKLRYQVVDLYAKTSQRTGLSGEVPTSSAFLFNSRIRFSCCTSWLERLPTSSGTSVCGRGKNKQHRTCRRDLKVVGKALIASLLEVVDALKQREV